MLWKTAGGTGSSGSGAGDLEECGKNNLSVQLGLVGRLG